jgi:hypothetical protein
MNLEEAYQLVDFNNKINVLWEERIILFEIYKEHCKNNGLLVPKNVEELLNYWKTNTIKEHSDNLKNDIN